MGAIHKGKSGEREAANWLQIKFGLEHKPTRNLDQTRDGGYDLNGFEPFAVEVKRCQQLSLKNWWMQVKRACPPHMIPVVMYRQNRMAWKFLIPSELIGVPRGYLMVEEYVFVKWAHSVMAGD